MRIWGSVMVRASILACMIVAIGCVKAEGAQENNTYVMNEVNEDDFIQDADMEEELDKEEEAKKWQSKLKKQLVIGDEFHLEKYYLNTNNTINEWVFYWKNEANEEIYVLLNDQGEILCIINDFHTQVNEKNKLFTLEEGLVKAEKILASYRPDVIKQLKCEKMELIQAKGKEDNYSYTWGYYKKELKARDVSFRMVLNPYNGKVYRFYGQDLKNSNVEWRDINSTEQIELVYRVIYNHITGEEIIPFYHDTEQKILVNALTGGEVVQEESIGAIGSYIERSKKVKLDNDLEIVNQVISKLSKEWTELQGAKVTFSKVLEKDREKMVWCTFEKVIDIPEDQKEWLGDTIHIELLASILGDKVYVYQTNSPIEHYVVSKNEVKYTLEEIKLQLETLINKQMPHKLISTRSSLSLPIAEQDGTIENLVHFKWIRYEQGYLVEGDGFEITYDLEKGKVVGYKMRWTKGNFPKMENLISKDEAKNIINGISY